MCTSPLVRYRLKRYIPPKLCVIPGSTEFVIRSQKKLELEFKNFGSFISYFDRYMDYQFIPCRKCDECKQKYAQDWSIRCYHEFISRGVASFITLTIDSTIAPDFNNNPKSVNKYCKRCVNGSRYYKYPIDYSLNKGLIYDWLKKFRDYLYRDKGISIRYFGCGEYGDNNERPHYHILIFGYDFPDKSFYKKSGKGVDLFLSEELSEHWKFGNHTVQQVNFQACMYTAKYCTKKMSYRDEQQEYEHYYGRIPEFLFMSKGNCQSNRCPYIDDIVKNCKGMKSLRDLTNPYCKNCDKTRGGLGYDWLLKYIYDVKKLGYIVVEGKKYSIPKYYLDIIKLTDKDYYDKYKLTALQKRDETFENDPLEQSTERLNVKKAVKRGKLEFYQRSLI